MRLTVMSDYAMRLLMHVANHPSRLCTISEVARVHDISQAHLMKVTHRLALAGWIETVRGKGGGMRLAAAPEQINLAAVLKSIEPDFAIVECLADDDHTACQLRGNCQLSGIMSGALQSFTDYLGNYTLADLLAPAAGGQGGPLPLTFHQRPAARLDRGLV